MSAGLAQGQAIVYSGAFPVPPFPTAQRPFDIGCINFMLNPIDPGIAGPFFFHDVGALPGFPEFFRNSMYSAGPNFPGVRFDRAVIGCEGIPPAPVGPYMAFAFLPIMAAQPALGGFGGGGGTITGPTVGGSVLDASPNLGACNTASCMYASWSATFTCTVSAQAGLLPIRRVLAIGGILPPGTLVEVGLSSTPMMWSDNTLQVNLRQLTLAAAADGRTATTLGPVPNPPLLEATVSGVAMVPIGAGRFIFRAFVIDQTAATTGVSPGTRFTMYNTFTLIADPGAEVFDVPLPLAVAEQYRDLLDGALAAGSADLNLACPADFNRDGFLNPDDLSDYITTFFTGVDLSNPNSAAVRAFFQADFNGDLNVDPDDLADFITQFFASIFTGAC